MQPGTTVQLDSTAWQRWLALVAAGFAVALPPAATAGVLVGPGAPLAGTVTVGIWILKGVLMLHALLFWLAPRMETSPSERGLLPEPRRPASGPGPGGGGEAVVRSPVPVLLVLTGTALLVRLPELGSGLWFDEIWTLVDYVRRSPGEIVATFDSTNQHVLYSLAAKASVASLGESAAALRLPAVVFGVGGVWATWWFGRRVAAEKEALLAAAFVALSYHHVWFSQNARGYTALLFWTLVSTALFVDLLRTTSFSWGRIAAYAVSTALALYTHLTAGAVLVTHAAIAGGLALRRPAGTARAARRSAGAGLALAASLGLLLYAPVLPQALETLTAPTTPGVAVEWENPVWLISEAAAGLAQGLPGGFLTLAAGGLVFAVGLASYAKRSPAVTVAMVLPAVLVLSAALVRSHNLWPRFVFFCAGFGVLVVVRGIFAGTAPLAGSRSRAVGTALALVLIAGSALTVPRAWGPKQDFRAAGRFVEDVRRPGDAVVALDLAALPLREYLGRDCVALDSGEELDRIEREHRTTWILYTFPTRVEGVHPELWARLQERYRRVAEFPGTVRGGTIVLMRGS